MFEIISPALPIKLAWTKLHRRYLPIIIGVAGSWLLFEVVIHEMFADHSYLDLHSFEWISVVDLFVLPLVAVNSIFLAQRALYPIVRSGAKMVALKTISSTIGVLIASLALEMTYAHFGYRDDDYLTLGSIAFTALESNVISNTFYAFVIGLAMFVWQLRVEMLYERLKAKELEEVRLKQSKTQAELHALQSRINPHFLFNSFNSIASLVQSDAKRAEKMIVQLSELFRYSLNSEESNFVAADEELKIVRTYFEVEKIRFGENLDYEIKVDDNLEKNKIPRFLIQPLAENAVKYATASIKQVEISIELVKEGEKLILKVFDNGPAFPEPLSLGYGLQSTFDKLSLLYPNEHSVEMINSPKHICITFISPKDE